MNPIQSKRLILNGHLDTSGNAPLRQSRVGELFNYEQTLAVPKTGTNRTFLGNERKEMLAPGKPVDG